MGKFDYDQCDISSVYDRSRELPEETIALWMRAITRYVEPPSVSTVLDLGCGTGRFVEPLARALGAKVLALDPSMRMLEVAKQKSAGRASGIAFYVVGQGESIPVRNACVDLVFLSQSYHHLSDRVQTLQEIRRVLRDGGYLALRGTTRENVMETHVLRFFPEARQIDMQRLPSRREVLADAVRYGFEQVACETLQQVFAADYAEYYQKISLRGLSVLRIVSDKSFQEGLARLREHGDQVGEQEPLREPMDLIVFRARKNMVD